MPGCGLCLLGEGARLGAHSHAASTSPSPAGAGPQAGSALRYRGHGQGGCCQPQAGQALQGKPHLLCPLGVGSGQGGRRPDLPEPHCHETLSKAGPGHRLHVHTCPTDTLLLPLCTKFKGQLQTHLGDVHPWGLGQAHGLFLGLRFLVCKVGRRAVRSTAGFLGVH